MTGRRTAAVGALMAAVVVASVALAYRNAGDTPAKVASSPVASACADVRAGGAPVFCIDLASLAMNSAHANVTDAPGLVDQLPACGTHDGPRPTFCVDLPSATSVTGSGGAAASPIAGGGDPCAQLATGEAPIFCLGTLVAPGGAAGRQAAMAHILAQSGTSFHDADAVGLHLELDALIGVPDAARLRSGAEADLQAVESYFGRRFVVAPTVLVLATRSSYAAALERLLGYAPASAAVLAAQTGGLYVRDPSVVFLNWENVGSGTLFALRHELTHALIREIVGAGAIVPAWVDEGLATLVQGTVLGPPSAPDRGTYAALQLLTQHRVTLDDLTALAGWPARNAALGGYAYDVAERGVAELIRHVSLPVLTRILAAERDSSFADAYAQVTGEPYASFLASFAAGVASCGPEIAIGSVGADRNVSYVAHGFGPGRILHLTIGGAAGYRLAFDAVVDDYGTYAGTFGATAPAGRYELVAVDGATSSSAVIETGSPSGGAAETVTGICGD